jgi:hypothetical protein
VSDIGVGLRQQIEQAAGTLAFAHFDGESVEAFGWRRSVLTHQDVCIKLVRALHGGEQRGARFRADEIRACQFRKTQAIFYEGARPVQIPTISFGFGEVMERAFFTNQILNLARDCQPLLIILNRLLRPPKRVIDSTQTGESDSFARPILYLAANQ